MSDQAVSGSPKADWYADPMGRHQYRYWDGSTWTDRVADGEQTSFDPVYPVNAAKSLGTTGGSARIERLIAGLKDPDDRVRQRTWQTLGKVRDPDDFERLIVALKDPDFNVRWGVSKALGLTRDSRAVEPLIAALKVTDKDKVVRWYAAESLGRIGDPRAVEPLIAALNDSYDPVRFAAAHSLGQIGDPRAVEPLVARLEDLVERVRWEATRALRKLGDPRGAEAHAGLKEESKAQRLRDQAQLASVPSAGGGTVLRDGDHVTCCVCNRQALVKVVGKKQRIDIIGPEQIESLRRQNVALQCQKCGVFVCFSCASSTSDAMGMMWCPKCNEAAGPSFIKGD